MTTTSAMLRNVLLLLCGLVLLLEISPVSCDGETAGEYGSNNEMSADEQEAVQNLLEQMYNNDVLAEDDAEELEQPSDPEAYLTNSNDKRFSEFLGGKKRFSEFLGGKKRFSEFLGGKKKRFSEFLGGKKRFSEFLGGKKKRFSEFLGGKKRFSEFLGGKKRFSEFLGGKKRFSEFLGGKKRFSEFLGGKRSSPSAQENRDFLGGH